jgi:RHS repeat-associated protein
MKYKLTFALVAALTSTAFAEFKAPLPEFKNEKQLAEWRAEKASEANSQGYVAEETAFYTGKPYLASSGGYAFNYRSYNPDLARWTSEDPSGFPDGANNHLYAPKPTTEIDPLGLAVQADITSDPEYNYLGPNYLSILVTRRAVQVPGVVAAVMDIKWDYSGGVSGWIVQKVENDWSKAFNADGTPYVLVRPPTPVYWEAWRVNYGAGIEALGEDIFLTPPFTDDSYGEFTKKGKVDFYSDSLNFQGNNPLNWSRSAVPDAGGLRATTANPSWWTGNGLNHNLKMVWGASE